MKRILEYGKYNQIKCSECGCIYSFDKEDISDEGMVECPCCNKQDKATIKASEESK